MKIFAFVSLIIGLAAAQAQVVFTDSFDSGTGAWYIGSTVNQGGDSTLDNASGQLQFTVGTAQNKDEVIGRSFNEQTLEVGQTIRMTFDFRQTTTTAILRAGFANRTATAITSDGWAYTTSGTGSGSYSGYYSFVRDNSAAGNSARKDTLTAFTNVDASGAPTFATTGINFPTAGTSDLTSFNINDDGTVTYQGSFEITRTSSAQVDTLLTLSSGGTQHFSIDGRDTSGTFNVFDTALLRLDQGTGFFDNISLSVQSPTMATVPNVVGLTQTAAGASIVGANLVVGTVTQQSSETVSAGNVISQNPVGGTSASGGSAVNLVVSTGPPPPMATVPNVVSLAQATAQANLLAANMTVGTVTQQSSATVPAGSVISQNPAGGTSLPQGSAVNLVVSSGPPPPMTTVPNVVGQAQATAEANLIAANLVVGTVTQQSSETVPAGSVISQSPVIGTSVPENSAVNLVVSSGPPPPSVTVPNVVDLAQASAEANLLAADLAVGAVTQQTSGTVLAGNVISQNPAGGTSAPEGSAVNLVVSSGQAPLTGTPIVSLNQIGYQKTAPKRFTAPVSSNGQSFQIASSAAPATVLFTGTITGGLGDFTAFQPSSAGPYVISYTPSGGSAVSSYPFLIQPDLIQEKLVKPAIDFMIDARSGVGTHPSAYGGNPWRDGTYYSFEVPSLIYLHLNARQTSNQKVGQINFNTEKTTVLSPTFPYVAETGHGDFLNELRRFYNTYEAPLAGCPDSVAAVHFGLGVTMAQLSGSKDPSGDPLPKHLHSQTREWFAWFLYAWPTLREHLPDSFYDACRDFTFANWAASSGLSDGILTNNQPSPLGIDPLWLPSSYGGHDKHPFKGRHAPGHSILPNLLLWQVALREGRSDAAIYLTAAQTQTQWIIDNLDWNDPRTTKGHRMSEHKMMTGLVHFLRNHPAQAPAGLAAKIEQWADVMISRSGNLWDFRRFELTDTAGDGVIDWSLPHGGFNWNEPGNLAGFPACALAAAWTLDHAPAKQQRLREMSQAAIDCLFGRNPLNTGSAARPQLGPGFPDQETSWTPLYQTGVAAYLETVRGSLSSGPASEHFPYNPAGAKRHPEGWVNFNAAFNMGLSYILADASADPEPLNAPFPLIISEILAQPSGNALAEFIELHNPTSEAVRLEGLTLSGDVTFAIPVATADLAPGARCLIVRDLSAFNATHGAGLPVIGSFSGDLDDSGAALNLGDVNGNTFLTLNRASLPSHPGHSQTLGQSGWRISANSNGSPGGIDSISFVGNPTDDTNHDGVPNLIHHAVTGTDRAFVAPQIDLSGPGAIVRVTHNLAADDTGLILEWCNDLTNWQNAGAPATIIPSGDRTAEWTFTWPVRPSPLFIRLKATR